MIKKYLVLAISLVFLVQNVSAQSQNNANVKNQFLGVRYKDYQELGSVSKINSTAINLHYGVAVMKRGEKFFLFLSKFENSIKHNDDFQLKVIDIIEIPKFNEFYQLCHR